MEIQIPMGLGPNPGEGLPFMGATSLGTDRHILMNAAIVVIQILDVSRYRSADGNRPDAPREMTPAEVGTYEAALKCLSKEFALGPKTITVEHSGANPPVIPDTKT